MQANGTGINLSPAVRHTIQNHGTDYYLSIDATNHSLIAGSIPDNLSRWDFYSTDSSSGVYTIRLFPTSACLYASSSTTLALHTCNPADTVWKTTATPQSDGYTIQNTAQGGAALRITGTIVDLAPLPSSLSPDFIWSIADIGIAGSLPPIVVPSSSSSSISSGSTGGTQTGSVTTVTSGQTTATQTASVTESGTGTTSASTIVGGGSSSTSAAPSVSTTAAAAAAAAAAGSGANERPAVRRWKVVFGIVALSFLLL